jgi:hypothetical protein
MTIPVPADAHPSPPSAFTGADICAAAGLAVPTGGQRPAFDDDAWFFGDVEGVAVHVHDCYLRMDFTTISDPRWRLVAKEYLLARLAPTLDEVAVLAHAYRTPLALTSCHHRLRALAGWLNWLAGQHVPTLGRVTQEHCDRYLTHRRTLQDADGNPVGQLNVFSVRLTAAVIIELACYAELFTADRYPPGFLPWAGRSAYAVTGAKPAGHNTTPVLRQDVLQPMLAAALYLTTTLAEPITTLRRHLTEHQRHARALPASPAPPAAIRPVLHQHESTGTALARVGDHIARARLSRGWAPDDPLLAVNFHALARQAGYINIRSAAVQELRPAIERTARLVGVERPWGREAPCVERADGTGSLPWTLPLDEADLRNLANHLFTACLLVTATVTGMRECELMELRTGCRRPPADGTPGRHRLAGTLVKGQPLGGTSDEWVVVPEVDHAVATAERLRAAEGDHDGDLLFGRFSFPSRFHHLRAWVNGPAGRRLGLAPIPGGPVSPRMLRRTLAQELAYRPGGLLAAKIHLKHVSVATTEGYANRPGGAQAKLLAEVGEHEADRNLELVLAEYRNYQQQIMPSGPGARDLAAFFAHVDADLATYAQSAPGVLDTDKHVANLLAKRAGTLHLGAANYCWFIDPSRALCLKLAGTPTADKPLAGMCDSARCPQATHHPCHRDIWADTARQTTVFLGTLGRTHTAERGRLRGELARAQRVLDAIDTASQPGTPAHDSGSE